MRQIFLLLSIVVLALAYASRPGIGEEAPDAPSAETIAAWIRSGTDADLDRAAKAAEKLDVAGLKRIFAALQPPAEPDVRSVLAKKRVKGLRWEKVTLDQALTYLRTISGVSFYVTPHARAERLEGIEITLALDDVNIVVVLDLLTEPNELAWRPQEGIVVIGTPEELKPAEEDAEAAALRRVIDRTRVTLSLDAATFEDVVKTLQIQTGLNLFVDPRVTTAVSSTVMKLIVTDVPLTTILNLICEHATDGLVWTVRGRVIIVTSRKHAAGR